MQRLPILFSFRRCPYAMRARLALAAAQQAVEIREVVLRDKPEELLRHSPKATVPVMVLTDGTVLAQSLEIMDWALAQHDPQHWRTPDVHGLLQKNDHEFKACLDHCKYASRHPLTLVEASRTRAFAFLANLDQRLGQHAGKGLMAERSTQIDAAIFPFVRQFAAIDPQFFALQPWPWLHTWLAHWQYSLLHDRIMHKYPQWRAESAAVIETWR